MNEILREAEFKRLNESEHSDLIEKLVRYSQGEFDLEVHEFYRVYDRYFYGFSVLELLDKTFREYERFNK